MFRPREACIIADGRPPPVVSHTDDEPGSLSQLVEDQEEDEFAEAALTVEEKEYLQMFCDPSDLCLVSTFDRSLDSG